LRNKLVEIEYLIKLIGLCKCVWFSIYHNV